MLSTKTIIMIVDDDTDDREIFTDVVKGIDDSLTVWQAEGMDQALSTIRQSEPLSPAYIFLDVNMPKRDGFECLAELRTLESLKSSHIFMYSTAARQRDVEKAKGLGAAGFLCKTSDIGELQKMIKDVLS